MTHPAPRPSATPGADVPQFRLGTALSTKLNVWLMAHPDEASRLTYAQLADVASAAFGLAFSPGHLSHRVKELRRAGDLPPKAGEVVPPAPPLAVPGPQLTLVKELEANEFETAAQTDQTDPAAQADGDDSPAATRIELLRVIRERIENWQVERHQRDEQLIELIELQCMLDDTPQASWAALSLVRRTLRRTQRLDFPF